MDRKQNKNKNKRKLSLCDIFSSKLDVELVFYSSTMQKRNIRQLTLTYNNNCI